MTDLKDNIRHGRVPKAGTIKNLGFNPHTDVELIGAEVLIARELPATESEGGIIIPDTAQELKHSGWILQKGPDCVRDRIAEGDRVLLAKWSAGIELEIDGREVIICREDDVVCKISDDFAERARRLD